MTSEQLERLDSCYFKYDISQKCSEELIDARKLICPQRFDLYANLLYIDHKVRGVKDMSYAFSVYKERTRAISEYTMKEPGNEDKDSFAKFVEVFDQLIDDAKAQRFNPDRTLIPVDKNYILLDGSHRASCAAYFGLTVKVLKFEDVDITHMSSDYLRKWMCPEYTLDAMALEACNWHEDLYMLFFWPKSFLQPEVLENAYKYVQEKSYVVYKKTCKLSYNAIRNIMIQIYSHMDWVGNIENNFKSTFVKADEVWDNNGKCGFFLIQAPSCEYVQEMKKEIREMFGVGLASLHSTDNMRETRIAADEIFNPNSLAFLNASKPTKFKRSYQMVEQFKQTLEDNHRDINNYIIDSSMILAIYGIRSAADLDYYTIDEENVYFGENSGIERHNSLQMSYYDNKILDLIASPKNYFKYNELKFVCLDKLLQFKKRRYSDSHDIKDKNDIVLINKAISQSNNKLHTFFNVSSIIIQRQFRILIKTCYDYRRKILKALYLYEPLRNLKKTLIEKGK